MNSTYLVSVDIRVGDFQKIAFHLVAAPEQNLACHYACYCEAQNPSDLEWCNDGVIDLGGEFSYTATAKPISHEDEATLRKFHNLKVINYSNLYESGNYSEFLSLIDYEFAVFALLGSEYIITPNKLLIKHERWIHRSYKEKVSLFDLVAKIAKEEHLIPKQFQLTTYSSCSVGVRLSKEQFEQVKAHYDVFSRVDVQNIIILDGCAFDETEMAELSELLCDDCSELAGNYVIFHYE